MRETPSVFWAFLNISTDATETNNAQNHECVLRAAKYVNSDATKTNNAQKPKCVLRIALE